MNNPYNLQNIWAATDKPAIDLITKKYHQAPSTIITNDSGDDNSDLESLDSCYGPFAAVPKEFRPPLSVRTKIERPQMSLNENKQALSSKNPISVSKHAAEKTAPKVPLLENPKPATAKHKTIASQNATQAFNKNVNISNHPKNSQKIHQNTDAVSTDQKNAEVKKYPKGNGKIFQPPKNTFQKHNKASDEKESKYENGKKEIKYENTFQNHDKASDEKESKYENGKNEIKYENTFQKHNKASDEKESRYENGKNEIKYEYIKRHGTIELNFEMSSKTNLFPNNGLKMSAKEVIEKREKQERRKNGYAASFRQNKVKWDSSLNCNKRNSDVGSKSEQGFGKVTHEISYGKNTLWWDSSLNRKDLDNDNIGKIDRDLSKKAQKAFYQENTIKWDSSLNHKDSSSDTEGEIEWTIIQETKTIVSTRKTDGNNHTHKQITYERLPPKHNERNDSRKSKKYHRKRNFNKYPKQSNVYHHNNTPKPSQRNAGSSVYKNDLQLNNKLRCAHTDMQNPDALKESSLDAEMFTRQCRISEQQNINKADLNLSNNRPDPHSEKIDNTALKLLEDQKQSMLDYGREIADLIIGSHTALSVFISTFGEWKRSRLELISHFEYLEKNLKESSKKFARYRDILNYAKTGASLAAAVPLPHVSIAARVISVLTGLFSVFLSTTEKQTTEVEDSNDISIAAIRDTSSSCDLYGYGLQCGLQFEDTAKLIEEFHSNAPDPIIFENESPEIAAFVRGLLEYRPTHRIFFKKLHKCFQELLQNCRSEFGKRFCEPFFLHSSDIIDIVGFLNWRFRHEDFNGESVRFELQKIEGLLEGNDISVKELATRIQNCIGFMQDELKFLEGCVKDLNLFDKSV